MTEHPVTREGQENARPGREAVTGAETSSRRRGEQPMVAAAKFGSYYGKPVINSPVWESPNIPGYLFLGGLAGASSALGAGAQLTGRHGLARAAKSGAIAAGCLSIAALVHDLGRPARFLHMMRTFKVTSPMSVGSWLLAGYVPAAAAAWASVLTGRMPKIGAAASAGSALLGPAVASYTAALISDTAVPAWHDGFKEMPFIFIGSAATAAGGLGMLAAPAGESAPACNLALAGVAAELAAATLMERRMGMTAEPYHEGKGGDYMKASKVLSAIGVAGAVLGRRIPAVRRAAGAALLVASVTTRWGIFHAGMASSEDPKYTVVPQRERVEARERGTDATTSLRSRSAGGNGARGRPGGLGGRARRRRLPDGRHQRTPWQRHGGRR